VAFLTVRKFFRRATEVRGNGIVSFSGVIFYGVRNPAGLGLAPTLADGADMEAGAFHPTM
jgi:hypothetical protein